MADPTCYFNGRFCSLNEVRIHPNDTGLLYGEGIYDVVPFQSHHPLWLDEHVAHWAASLKELKIDQEIDWHDIIKDLAHSSSYSDGYIYLYASTGPIEHRSLRKRGTTPTLLAQPMPMPKIPASIAAVCVDDNVRCAIRRFKHTSKYVTRTILSHYPHADEIIYLQDQTLLEGGSSNLFVIKNDVLLTPPDTLIYPGVTRKIILSLAKKHNIPTKITPIHIDDISPDTCVFLTGSIKKCLPIHQLNDMKLTTSPLFHTLSDLYCAAIEKYVSQYQTTS